MTFKEIFWETPITFMWVIFWVSSWAISHIILGGTKMQLIIPWIIILGGYLIGVLIAYLEISK